MATWNGGSFPNGALNLPDNRTGIRDNFIYIEDTLGADHFWANDAAKDGYHQQVNMETKAATPGVALDSVFYTNTVNNLKTTKDEKILYYRAKDHDGNALPAQPLSFGTVWAYVVFDPKTVPITAAMGAWIKKSKNITKVGYNGDTAKTFSFTMTNVTPDTNYMIFGSVARQTSAHFVTSISLQNSGTTTSNFDVLFTTSGSPSGRPQSGLSITHAWVMVVV